jgi:predicted nucleic acid-binding protein
METVAQGRLSLHLTEHIARKELNMLAREVEALEKNGTVRVEPVPIRSEAGRLARTLKNSPREGLHVGEAEAIAWAVGVPAASRPLFVSNDRRAREGALRPSVPAGDRMDLIGELIDAGLLHEKDAAEKVAVWSDKGQDLCRPRDFTTFAALLERRRQRGPLR